MEHIEYELKHHFDIINKDATDFPFDDYADFFVDCSNATFAIPAIFNLLGMFWDDEQTDNYTCSIVGISTPYLVLRIQKE